MAANMIEIPSRLIIQLNDDDSIQVFTQVFAGEPQAVEADGSWNTELGFFVWHASQLYRRTLYSSVDETGDAQYDYAHWNNGAWYTIKEEDFRKLYNEKGKLGKTYSLEAPEAIWNNSSSTDELMEDITFLLQNDSEAPLTQTTAMAKGSSSVAATTDVPGAAKRLRGSKIVNIVRLINTAWDVYKSYSHLGCYTLKYTSKKQLKTLLKESGLEHKKIEQEVFNAAIFAWHKPVYKIHLSRQDVFVFSEVLSNYNKWTGEQRNGDRTLLMLSAQYLSEEAFILLLNTDFSHIINKEIVKRDRYNQTALHYIAFYQTDAALISVINFIDQKVLDKILLIKSTSGKNAIDHTMKKRGVIAFSAMLNRMSKEAFWTFLMNDKGLFFKTIIRTKSVSYCVAVLHKLRQFDDELLTKEEIAKDCVNLQDKSQAKFNELMMLRNGNNKTMLILAASNDDDKVRHLLRSLISDELLKTLSTLNAMASSSTPGSTGFFGISMNNDGKDTKLSAPSAVAALNSL